MESLQNGLDSTLPSTDMPGLQYDAMDPQTIPDTSLLPPTSLPEAQPISADEIALYDRQIRLWGLQAQQKIRSAKILLITMKALANEIAKNLVLAGIGSLTIMDNGIVTKEDLASQFFVSEEHVGQNRAQAALPQLQKFNPRVQLAADTDEVYSKNPEFYSAFDVTIATELDIDTLSTINASCRIFNRRFYAGGTHGLYGYAFADLISHDFVIERAKSNVATPQPNTPESVTRTILSATTKKENGKTIELVTKNEMYSPIVLANTSPLPEEYTRVRRRRLQVTPLLTCLRALWEFQKLSMGRLPSSHNKPDLELFTTLATDKHKELQLPHETLRSDFLRSFLQNLGSEISPAAAFVGGALAQDVINVLGAREQPLQNLLLFDGEECKGPIYAMHPNFPPSTAGMMANGDSITATILDGPEIPPAIDTNGVGMHENILI